MSDTSTTPSKAGITLTPDGQCVIPSSVRPDGSTRREIRVRPGYRPPEDVEVYKNRTAEAWKNRGTGGVPGATPTSDDDKKAPTDPSNKNAKRREARRKAKEVEAKEAEAGIKERAANGKTEEVKERNAESSATESSKTTTQPKAEPDAEAKEKLAKAIRKKIRQANDLKDRKEGGESLLPEQLEKVIKMNELVRQLNSLGFDQ